MIKILHVYRSYYPDTHGGIEEVIRQLTHKSAAQTIDARIFALSKKPMPVILAHEGTPIHRSQEQCEIASCNMSLSAFSDFKKQVVWADLIHYHFPWPFADLLHLMTQVKKPSVVTYHSDIVRQKFWLKLYSPLQNTFLKSVNTIVATSPNYLKSSAILNKFKEKTTVIPLGIEDVSQQSLLKPDALVKGEYVLFVGVLRYYKGLSILLEAASQINTTVVIAGSGPEEGALKAQAKALKLTNVIFTGYVSEEQKLSLLKHCLAFVFPSHLRSEAFGVSLLEAAMFAKPLISAEINSGMSYINQHETTGLIIKPNSPKHLAKAVNELVSAPNLVKHYGKQARERYLALFTSEKMRQSYLALYQSELDNKLQN